MAKASSLFKDVRNQTITAARIKYYIRIYIRINLRFPFLDCVITRRVRDSRRRVRDSINMGLRIDADGASNIEIAAELSPILIEVEGCFVYI